MKGRVYDRWWPWIIGVVVRDTGASVYVRWDGEDHETRYDKAHRKFLVPEKGNE